MRHQRGEGVLSMVGLIVGIVIIAIVGMKVGPLYYEFFVVKKALSTVAKQDNVASLPVPEIRRLVGRQFEVDSATIKSVTPAEVEVSKGGGRTALSVSYTVRENLFANVSICVDFDATASSSAY